MFTKEQVDTMVAAGAKKFTAYHYQWTTPGFRATFNVHAKRNGEFKIVVGVPGDSWTIKEKFESFDAVWAATKDQYAKASEWEKRTK